MELPFAVESPERVSSLRVVSGAFVTGGDDNGSLHQHSSGGGSSLVTASSQGSLMNSNLLSGNSPLPPNTPQDVVLHYDNSFHQQQQGQQQHRHQTQHQQHQQHLQSGQMMSATAIHQQQLGRMTAQQQQQQSPQLNSAEPDLNDFTYVDVCETDADEVDILIEGGYTTMEPETRRGDVLTVLLSGMPQQETENEELVVQTEQANQLASRAAEAKKCGDMETALDYHSQAARKYNDISLRVRSRNASLASSLQLLSQAQAKSALALQRIVKLSSSDLQRVMPSAKASERGRSTTAGSTHRGSGGGIHNSTIGGVTTHKERLRAAVRGALGSHHRHEADLSDSTFLGSAADSLRKPFHPTPAIVGTAAADEEDDSSPESRGDSGTLLFDGHDDGHHNPVDEMMELERELRDMDMALELGSSISSLDARMQNRMKNSMIDGSFMVVPPGSQSYMSSSMWGSGHNNIPNSSNNNSNNNTASNNNSRPPNAIGTAGVRARANRVQNVSLGASVTPATRAAHHPPNMGGAGGGAQVIAAAPPPKSSALGLESSWWGNTSTSGASQILASSVMSGVIPYDHGPSHSGGHHPQQANTKQVMRLMDSLKTLGEENATLLREVEDAEAARMEAKATREQMKRFKTDYGKRFATLRAALEKFRKEHSDASNANSGTNPVNGSEFFRSASVTEQLQRQEQLIRKLTTDLKKEKEESKKKDAALRKYESFYREVKARSAQKAAQKNMETQQRSSQQPAQPQPPKSRYSTTSSRR